MLQIANPTYWFFGHWHTHEQGRYQDVIWAALNTITPGFEEGGRSYVDVSSLFYTDADVEEES